jgi:hypothetical protein
MRRATFTAIVAATTLLPMPAWAAAAPRAGVLPLDVEGKLPPNGAKELSAAFDKGLTDAGVTVVPAAELAASGVALASCRDEACLQGLAGKTSATHFVRAAVRLEESDYVIAVDVIDGATGKVVHQASQTCELCGLSEALAVASTLAASLEPQLAVAATGTVSIQSTPEGAQVLVDGEPAGTTPLELALAPGEHTIVLRRDGYVDDEHSVTVEAGATAEVAAELAVAAPVVVKDEKPDRSALLRPLGWAALGVGIASLGAGIALLAVDEKPVEFTRCSGIDVDMEGNCRFRHDTLAGGVVMTIVGVVGITAGALLVARTSKKRGKGDERRARLRPTLRGMAIQF